MSDDLVKRLRDLNTHMDTFILDEAVDRIEQLETSSEGWKEIADEYFDAIGDYKKVFCGKWVYEFEAPVGTRILSSRFIGITTLHTEYWWSYQHKKWTPLGQQGDEGATSTVHCNSFKAFKKHLKHHHELIYAEKVILVSRFIGHNITARYVDANNTSSERV